MGAKVDQTTVWATPAAMKRPIPNSTSVPRCEAKMTRRGPNGSVPCEVGGTPKMGVSAMTRYMISESPVQSSFSVKPTLRSGDFTLGRILVSGLNISMKRTVGYSFLLPLAGKDHFAAGLAYLRCRLLGRFFDKHA